jgi:signal peptidase I
MFGIFLSQRHRARHDARNWLHLAAKVCNYRRDQLPPQDLHAVQKGIEDLKARLREGADAPKLKMAMEQLEATLRRCGGSCYPKSALADNVEFFLVAAIVFLGIRAFFVQPFKIPTNSMWPSYYGMTHEVFRDPAGEPGSVAAALRLAAFGATTRRIDAPVSGEVVLPLVVAPKRGYTLAHEIVSQRRWIFFPGEAARYTLLVGTTPVTVTVPVDFRFDRVVEEAFFDNKATLAELYRENQRGFPLDGRPVRVRTGRTVAAGQRILSFAILTGDQLFVDRLTYHFFPPEVGQGFVFRTGNIPGIGSDNFYIKRLVGVPGDTLEVREPVLCRNGKPIEGAAAFDRNARREGLYRGYVAAGSLADGHAVTVPEGEFLALGDNSRDSFDGRMWGFVPEADVVGRPLFIYYPFTRRWGPAR